MQKQQQFEKAPEDLPLFKSSTESYPSLKQPQQVEEIKVSNISAAKPENIKAKIDELKSKMEQIKIDRDRIEREIRDIQAKPAGGEDYSWQQGEPVKGHGLPLLLIVALLSFFIGRLLIMKDGHHHV